MARSLRGEIAAITGAASGTGLATSEALQLMRLCDEPTHTGPRGRDVVKVGIAAVQQATSANPRKRAVIASDNLLTSPDRSASNYRRPLLNQEHATWLAGAQDRVCCICR